MGRYETGLHLLEAGVISGYDSTPECAVTKLMFLLGHGLSQAEIRRRMNSDLAGELPKRNFLFFSSFFPLYSLSDFSFLFALDNIYKFSKRVNGRI